MSDKIINPDEHSFGHFIGHVLTACPIDFFSIHQGL